MSKPDQAPDPYAAVSVHGLWPLVVDPSSAAGIRFADLSVDAPGDCVASPRDLPDVSLSIRSFNSSDDIKVWALAAREFGGNAVVVVQGPPVYSMAFQYALVARLDRDRNQPASTLEDAIPLIRDAERKAPRLDGRDVDPGVIGADARGRVLASLAESHARRAWSERWKGEIEAMRASGVLKPHAHTHVPGGHLSFAVGDAHGEAGRLEGSPGMLRAVVRAPSPESLDPDLAKAWVEALSGHGWTLAPDGIALEVGSLDTEASSRIASDAKALWAVRRNLEVRRASRLTLLSLSLDPETVKVLRRIAAGFPVASGRFRDPGAQYNPRTGKVQVVASSRVGKAHAIGLIQPVWWRDSSRGRSRDDFPVQALDHITSILWGLTETGRAFVEGRLDLAEITHPADEATAQAWSRCVAKEGVRLPRPHDGLAAVAARLPAPSGEVAERVAQLVRNETGARHVPTWPSGLAIAGVALACGVLYAEGETLAPVSPPTAPTATSGTAGR